MSKMYVYDIYDLITIASNVKSDRIFDTRFISYEIESNNFKKYAIDMVIKVISCNVFKDLVKSYLEKKPLTLSFSYALPEGKSILHYQRFLGSFLGIYVENLEGTTYVVITDTLFRFKFSIPLRELLIPEDIGHIFLLKLLQKNCFIIHGALLDISGHITSIVAMPDVGKTLTSVSLALERKAKIFSDDMSIICADGKAYGLPPRSISLGTVSEKPLISTQVGRLKSLLYNSPIRYLTWLPYIGFNISNLMNIPISKFNELCGYCVDKGSGVPEYLFILEKGGDSIKTKSLESIEASEKVLNTAIREWYYFDINPLLLKYAYANSNFKFFTLLKKREEIIKAFVSKIPNIMLVRAPSSIMFKDIIYKIVSLS